MGAAERGLGDAPFGLVGRRLGHSWSPHIHERLGSAPYRLVELEPDEVEPFVRGGAWRGLNVTIPYKTDAVRLADVRSPAVEALGAANTLVRDANGRIVAENTDVLGFSWLLDRFCRTRLHDSARRALEGREVLVLGSGGASRAVCYALETVGGAVPRVISRRGPDSYDGLAERHPRAALVVNTTPVGMFPGCPASPLDGETLDELPELLGVLDIVYNPLPEIPAGPSRREARPPRRERALHARRPGALRERGFRGAILTTSSCRRSSASSRRGRATSSSSACRVPASRAAAASSLAC